MTKEEIIKKLTAHVATANVTIIGYMMFLNDKGLGEEASRYVEGLIQQITPEEWDKLIANARAIADTSK